MAKGKIRTIKADKGFGFILDDNRVEYFFHRSECNGQFNDMVDAWDDGANDVMVEFIVVDSEKGPRAHDVRFA